jgi:hypothetical protein
MRRTLALLGATLVVALGLAAAPVDAAPIAAATAGCRAVGGGEVAGPGPARATVVVDTGSGPVWSACVSFSGTISGTKALELAGATIADLDPVYDTYAGEGRAVCRLRGVGTDPPDCLGKSVDYWSFWVNGTYARGGAGSTVVRDGDVHAWRHGTGSAPRAATAGTEAFRGAPATTTTTTPRTTTTTRPRTGAASGSGATGSDATGGGPAGTPTTAPAEGAGSTSSTAPGATTSTTTAAPDADGSPDDEQGEPGEPEAAAVAAATASASDDGGDESASAAAGSASAAGGGGSSDGGGGGSSLGAIVGFVAVLAGIGGAGLLVRRRRMTLAV